MKTKSAVKRIIVFVCLISVLAGLGSCKPTDKPADRGPRKIKVVATIFPLYDMARSIGGDEAEVTLLLPPGVEAHSYEPKPSDIIKISEADIFIYTGNFMEPWAESIIKAVANKKLLIVDSSWGVKTIQGTLHNVTMPAGPIDPHIWLDFDNAKVMLRNIAEAFRSKDSSNSFTYDHKSKAYVNRLTELDNAYRATLEGCKSREIVYAGHYAFGYMARRYGLKYHAVQGVSPDSEPTAGDLVRLVKQIRKSRTRYIFYEELASPKIAETIAGETNAKMLLLNAAHNLAKDDIEKGVSFFDILRRDLDSLKVGLECRSPE